MGKQKVRSLRRISREDKGAAGGQRESNVSFEKSRPWLSCHQGLVYSETKPVVIKIYGMTDRRWLEMKRPAPCNLPTNQLLVV